MKLTKDKPSKTPIKTTSITTVRRKKARPVSIGGLRQPKFIGATLDDEPKDVSHPDIDRLLAQMCHLKEQGARFLELEAQAITLCERYGLDSYKGCTLVRGETTTIDYIGLLRALTPEQRRLIMVPAVDASKLEGAIKTGQVPAGTVGRFTTTKPSKPYFTNISKFDGAE